MPTEVEALIVEWRRAVGGLDPVSIVSRLRDEKVTPLAGRSPVYRCLVRHDLVVPVARKPKREDDIRWERSRAMELWQMDIVGGVKLADRSEAKIVSGIDDHSRFIVRAHVVERGHGEADMRWSCESYVHLWCA